MIFFIILKLLGLGYGFVGTTLPHKALGKGWRGSRILTTFSIHATKGLCEI